VSDVQASVWTPDLATELAVIPNRKGLTWQDPLNSPGMGSLAVPYDDPAAQYLKDRNIVRLWYQGDYRYAYRIQKPKNVVVDVNGEADRWLTAAGPGVMSILGDAALFPEYGLVRQSGAERAFSFASASGNWYVSSEWVAPLGVVFTSDTGVRAGNPKDWPDKGASWIWDTSPTTNDTAGKVVYFRSSFSLSATTDLTIFATADNYFELYLDGQQILASDLTDPYTWQRTSSYPTTLAAGTHLLAARVTNEPIRTTSNPAGFLCAVATVNTSGQPQTIIRHTDTSNWLCRPEGSAPPGWHAAQVLATFVSEAQARSSNWKSLGALTIGFTPTTDTAGNAWTDLLNRTFTVGTKGVDLVTQLCEQGIDIAVSPSLAVQAWKQRGTDKSTGANPVVLRPALNLKQYEVETDLAIVTHLLVRTPNGWVEVAASNEATDGRCEDLLDLGNASSDAQATSQAQSTFTDIGQPLLTHTATCLPVAGATPYVDFGLGDTVLAPDGAGAAVAARVMTISVTEDDKGDVSFVPELYK
jgi:hypothetical protein